MAEAERKKGDRIKGVPLDEKGNWIRTPGDGGKAKIEFVVVKNK